MRQSSKAAALLLGAFAVLGSVACGAGTEKGAPPHGNNGGSAGTGGSGPAPSSVCGTSQVGAPRLRRLSRTELLSTLADVFPEAKDSWKLSLSADPISSYGFDNDSTLLVVGKQTAAELDTTGDAVGAAVSGPALATLLPCSASAPDATCAQQFVDKYGKRLFRRALTAEESARYAALFQQVSSAKDFATGIRFVTRALVQSPHAVYRREVGVASGNDYQLTPSELATELAYDFTGTAPSDDLLAAAEAGQLASPAALEAKAHELLLSQPGMTAVERFFDAWLGYGRASSVTKPGVPEFANLRDAMVAEARYFLGEVVVTRNGGLNELLTASFTMPSQSLAAFYGFPAPASDNAAVERPAGKGIGILAQGALLATLSGPNASSPTKRGVMVMDRLLCRTRPMVPPGVPPLSAPQPGTFTTRQHYEEIHAKDGSCKACHSLFDPIGFGFEHYDEVGRYRDMDGGLPVDSASYVPSVDGTAHLFDFQNLEELAQGLAAQKAPYECTTGYLSTYVFGAPEACLGEAKRGAFIDHKLGFVDYLASLAAEPHFSQRRLQ
jgi:hypothetical protein